MNKQGAGTQELSVLAVHVIREGKKIKSQDSPFPLKDPLCLLLFYQEQIEKEKQKKTQSPIWSVSTLEMVHCVSSQAGLPWQ